jgi:Histidine kinase-, DNA gyrase B-, and HSP90-like ATPase
LEFCCVEMCNQAIWHVFDKVAGMQVKDTGIGIPESFRPYLFDSFTQATESCTRTHGGLGLGLAICFNLARLMHADLSIESREGGGSTATLSLCMPLATGSIAESSSDTDMSSSIGSIPEGAEVKDGLQSPTCSSSVGSRNSTASTASSGVEETAAIGDRQTDASSVFAPQRGAPSSGRLPSFTKLPDAGVSLHGTDTSIPKLLADSRIKVLQQHSAVLHTHSMAVSRQLQRACSALGMAVFDMPVIKSPQSFEQLLRGKPDGDQLRGIPILFCNMTDATTALRNGWKKQPVVALCADGRLPHALRVHVTPVAMPVKLRALISAVLLALHGGMGKVSLLHVPLGTPKAVANSAGVACTAGFGGTFCGFCTRCQRSTDASALVRCCTAWQCCIT